MSFRLWVHPAIKRSWLAKEMGVDRSTVSRWISGEREIPPERILQAAKVLTFMPIMQIGATPMDTPLPEVDGNPYI